MIFILYSHIDQANIDSSLGLPEYSYYFVLREFRLALEQLGTVVMVEDPEAEVDAIYYASKVSEEACVFISFSPPNKAPVGLACPSICVFAWEFSSIPDETWDDDPRNDWRTVFNDHGRVITLSEYAVQAVKAAMGEDFPVVAIPVPVWDRFVQAGRERRLPLIESTLIEVSGHIIDSQLYCMNSETLKLHKPERCFLFPPWDDHTLDMDCSLGGGGEGYLVGFYEPESWGTWSKVEEPWILLPYRIDGDIKLTLSARGYGHNVNREVCVKIGDCVESITLLDGFKRFELEISLHGPVTTFKILGLDLTSVQNVADPRTMGIALESFTIERFDLSASRSGGEAERSERQQSGSEAVSFNFKEHAPELRYLVGFYDGEFWGVWSRTTNPAILLSSEVIGRTTVYFGVQAYGANIGRKIRVELGERSTTIVLARKLKTYTLHFDLELPAEVLRFFDLDVSPLEGASDPRTMGIGINYLRIEGGQSSGTPQLEAERVDKLSTRLSGVVYTSVFNPGDNRKNWQDMLIAFICAFRDIEDATLVLKVSNNSVSSYLGLFHYFLQRLAPFQCRVVIIHGFLDDSAYRALIQASSYYVNTSHCEGLCLPLMEFMACGKPGIVPQHTSMNDYVSGDTSFIIESTVEPGIWPHDPRDVFRALRYRINQWSLINCFKESYLTASNDVMEYTAMSDRSMVRMNEFCSVERVVDMLSDFLEEGVAV